MNLTKKNNSLLFIPFAVCTVLVFIGSSVSNGQSSQAKDAFHHIEIEQPSRAVKTLDELSVADKPTHEQQYYVGLGYLRVGRLDNALKPFEKRNRAQRKHGLNYAGKEHVLILKDDVAGSLNKAVKIDSLFTPAYKKLGEIYYLRKEADKP